MSKYLFYYLFILALNCDTLYGEWIYDSISANDTITFDDLFGNYTGTTGEGHSNYAGYPRVVYNNTDLVVTIDGSFTCYITNYVQADGTGDFWRSNWNWAGSSTEQPDWFVQDTKCTLRFSRPVNAFLMRIGYNVPQNIDVYDDSDTLMAGTVFTPNTSLHIPNDYNYFGYSSSRPLISSFVIYGDDILFDNVQFAVCSSSQLFNGTACVDLCILNPCVPNASCDSSQGFRNCTCNDGYEQQGTDCVDINECDASPCGPGGQCNNTAGSFECNCYNGYENKGLTCTDVDECSLATLPCSPQALCNNTEGSFYCTCNAGYEGDGLTCDDINECSLPQSPCDLNAFCNNTDGSFECSCKEGYTGKGDGTNGCAEIEVPQTQPQPMSSDGPIEQSKTVSSSTSLTSEKVILVALVALAWL